jgi:hypothetical protein
MLRYRMRKSFRIKFSKRNVYNPQASAAPVIRASVYNATLSFLQ